jgi:formate hydrogenlyase transcriptional activator
MNPSEGQTRPPLEDAFDALKKSEAQLRTFIDRLPALAWCLLPDGSIEFFNQQWHTYTGLSDEEMRGSGWKSAVHADDIERVESWWQGIVVFGEPAKTEARFRRFDGEYRWFQISAVPVRDEQGNVVRWYGINVDRSSIGRSIADAICQSVVVLAPDGTTLYANRVTLEQTGLTIQEMNEAGPFARVLHPDDIDRFRAERHEGLLRGAPFEYEMRVLRKGGQYRWHLIQYNPLKDEQGQIVRWYATATDIDDLKRAEEKLRRSEGYLAEAQRLTHTGSWAWNVATSHRVHWSQENYRLFGFDPERGLPSDEALYQRIHPEDRDRVRREAFPKRTAEGCHFDVDYRIVLPDGTIKHLHSVGHPVLDKAGHLVEFVGTTMDITERKQAEDKIREQEVELRQTLDAATQHLSVLRGDGSHLYINQCSLDFLGVTLEQWQKLDIRELVHPDDAERVGRERLQALSSGCQLEIETRLRRHDGEYRWLLLHYKPLRDQRGRITRWVVPAIDIDDRKKAEERTRNENLALREQIDRDSMFEDIVGSSEALAKVLGQVARVAAADSTVLILGETGTGKELIARAIHRRSNRAERAFIAVNCAAIPASLIASELFGFEKGAFTGATQRRLGRFESANGGTIFLDEVGDLPPEIQIALLRVLQEREIERVGSNKPISVDVRVLSATHRDLNALVAEGKFRQDLLYRLNVVPIKMPPLRERAADVPLLVEYFIDRFGKKTGKKFRTIDRQTLKLFQAYGWPGNIRELQNVIERAVILSDGDTFSVDDTWFKQEPPPHIARPTVALGGALLSQEKEMIEAALAESHGRISGPAGAAAKLALPARTLESKIKRLGINKFRFKVPRAG